MYEVAVKDYATMPFRIVEKTPGVVEEFLRLVSDLYHDFCLCREGIPTLEDLMYLEEEYYPPTNETVNGFLDGMILELMHRPNTFLEDFLVDLPEDVTTDSVADFLHGCWDDMKPYYVNEIRIALDLMRFSYRDEWGEVRNSHVVEVW